MVASAYAEHKNSLYIMFDSILSRQVSLEDMYKTMPAEISKEKILLESFDILDAVTSQNLDHLWTATEGDNNETLVSKHFIKLHIQLYRQDLARTLTLETLKKFHVKIN